MISYFGVLLRMSGRVIIMIIIITLWTTLYSVVGSCGWTDIMIIVRGFCPLRTEEDASL